MIKFYYNGLLIFEDKKNKIYHYDVRTNRIIKQQNKIVEKSQKNENILFELCSLLYRNDILNLFKKKGIDFRTNNFYETVCDILFEYEEDSEEYKLLNNFIVLAADYQIT